MAEPSYARRLFAKAIRETTRFTQHKLLTGAAVAIATVIVRLALWHFHRITLMWAEVSINLLIIAGSFVIVLLGAVIVNLFRATALLDRERSEENAALAERLITAETENRELEQQLTKSGELSEYDPKIYLDPLNGELRNTGTIPFELSNKGQRVNVAHRITVLPISALPSVSLEYVDHLEMAERKQLLPIVSPTGRDIVAELTRAWQSAGNPSGQLEMEFRFEIKLTYEDVSRTRKFETTVQLSYFPEEANKAKAPAAPGFWKERTVIRVNDTTVSRLS